MMHTARKDQHLSGSFCFVRAGEVLRAKMGLRCGCAAFPLFSLNFWKTPLLPNHVSPVGAHIMRPLA